MDQKYVIVVLTQQSGFENSSNRGFVDDCAILRFLASDVHFLVLYFGILQLEPHFLRRAVEQLVPSGPFLLFYGLEMFVLLHDFLVF